MTTSDAPFFYLHDPSACECRHHQRLRAYYISMSDEPSETDTGRNPEPPNPVRERVDGVIKDLTERITPEPDCTRLRKALDSADAPETGRGAADKALGRVAARG